MATTLEDRPAAAAPRSLMLLGGDWVESESGGSIYLRDQPSAEPRVYNAAW